MNIKVLVLGGTGMLGHMVLKVLSTDKHLSVNATHLTDPSDPLFFDVEQGLDKLEVICRTDKGCKYIINCIGITAVNIILDEPASLVKAISINAVFSHQLGLFCSSHGIRLIHISTDGVFSGRSDIYDEDSECDCLDFYGKTKCLGEVFNNSNVINIRCSLIGPSPYEKGGLWEWFCSQPTGASINGYTNHLWNGVTTYQFAEICRRIITQNRFQRLRMESPVFHFAPNQPISKYELLNILKDALNKNVSINATQNPKGAINRILVSKYIAFKKLYQQDIPMHEAVKQSIGFLGA